MMKMLEIKTKGEKETKKVAEMFGREILTLKISKAVAIGLEGDLGAGKTTFAKGFAKGLGIKEEMKSPTFILMRVFRIPRIKNQESRIRHFLHFDAYRIDSAREFASLGFEDFLKDAENILLIEWSDKIKKILPENYFLFRFKHLGKNNRLITLFT